MQQLRFSFAYRVELHQEIVPEELYLPVMLLQPFVENAIEHGLNHPEVKEPTLEIKISPDSASHFLVVIQDNGAGRQEKKVVTTGKVSRATQITEDRAQLMQGKFHFEIKDLVAPKKGTAVFFYITCPESL
jgi:sensor histidine kinase YesM